MARSPIGSAFAVLWAKRRPIVGLVAALLLVGCASHSVSYPPIVSAPSGRVLVGKFVWYDLVTENPERAREFYSALFGWEIEDSAPGYTLIQSDGQAIGGIAKHEGRDEESRSESLWVPSLSVADVDVASSRAESLGGQVIEGPLDLPGRGRLVAIRDSQGATLVLLRSAGGDPPDGEPRVGSFLWTDLWVREAGPAQRFYSGLVGYESRGVSGDAEHRYHLFRVGNRPRAGLIEIPWEDVEPNWLPYVRVESLNDTLSKARELGGQVLIRRGDVAILVDPSGAALGIQEYSGQKGKAS